MDVRKTKRRQFSCMYCVRAKRSHVAERYRMVAHIYKHHLALDQAPFYCTLCLFRCTTKDALDRHVVNYAKHATEAANIGGDPGRFLGQNPNPRLIQEGIDFRLATAEELSRGSCKDPLTLVDDEPVKDALSPDGLISVKLTPGMLADILNRHGPALNPLQSQGVPGYDTLRPGYGDLQLAQSRSVVSSSLPGSTLLPTYVPTVASLPGKLPSSSSAGNQQSDFQWTLPSSSVASDYYTASKLHTVAPALASTVPVSAPSLGDTFITSGLDSAMSSPVHDCLEKPAMPMEAKITTKPPSLSTPLLDASATLRSRSPSVVDIKDQLLGADEPGYVFSPITKMDTACQTVKSKDDLSPSATSMAVTHLEAALHKVTDAIERSGRALRDVDRSLTKMVDSFARVERSLDRLVTEQRASGRRTESHDHAEKRLKLDENRKPLTSCSTSSKRNSFKK